MIKHTLPPPCAHNTNNTNTHAQSPSCPPPPLLPQPSTVPSVPLLPEVFPDRPVLPGCLPQGHRQDGLRERALDLVSSNQHSDLGWATCWQPGPGPPMEIMIEMTSQTLTLQWVADGGVNRAYSWARLGPAEGVAAGLCKLVCKLNWFTRTGERLQSPASSFC